MSEPTACAAACCRSIGPASGAADVYCVNCDVLVGLSGLHVVAVDPVQLDAGEGLVIAVESPPTVMGCPACGVVARSHGRRTVELIDAPCFGRPVRLRWHKRTWTCPDPGCPMGTFTEQDEQVAAPRALLTARACRWAIEQIRREHASVAGLARRLGTTWRTVWRAIRPLLAGPPTTRAGSPGSGGSG
jgi:transposase